MEILFFFLRTSNISSMQEASNIATEWCALFRMACFVSSSVLCLELCAFALTGRLCFVLNGVLCLFAMQRDMPICTNGIVLSEPEFLASSRLRHETPTLPKQRKASTADYLNRLDESNCGEARMGHLA